MPARPAISVCMAAYNGALHIQEQLDSILAQLREGDEVVIVDDGSTDGTREWLGSLDDPRVKVHLNESNLGYVGNFEKALRLSRGEVVMLSDQDDVWLPGRVDALVSALDGAEAVASNFSYFEGTPRPIERLRLKDGTGGHRVRNLLRLWIGIIPYYGCAMAFRRSFVDVSLPFPSFLFETHDQWLAMLANVRGSMHHLERETLSRRLHESNTTPKSFRGLRPIVRSRWMLGKAFVVALGRRSA
ncbi:glycosyltransferase [Sinomonas sp. ASV486]|uniref:glycosyltransferase n=1 Tax=Sinomonas sp. ASV486 TaxID=3051170 RepID=UPI0027DBA2E4|nr:glycosyltransferase [Sinomonas sp. ASV486]MDQ4490978.1 glycosyltransferase [Sinomonas sp. ASV486]